MESVFKRGFMERLLCRGIIDNDALEWERGRENNDPRNGYK